MKILFTIYSLSGGTGGGAERLLSIMANYWSKHKKNISILTFTGNSGKNEFVLDSSITKIRLGIADQSYNIFKGLQNNIKRIINLRKKIREIEPDIIISFMTKTNILILLASIRKGIPVIAFELSDPSQSPAGKIWRFLRRRIYRLADWIVVQNQHALNYFLPKFKNKTSIIHNPAIVDNLSIHLSNRKDHLIVSMGRLESVKGFDILLQAFSILNKEHPDVILKIIGDGPMRHEYEDMIIDLNIKDKVKFLGWINDPYKILQEASFFVLSSRYEGFPMSILEAMACGLPVISTDCPSGPSEIIRNGIDGILVPNEDVAALYTAMKELITNHSLRRCLSIKALEVTSRFSIDRIMTKWNDLINKFCI